MNLLQKVLSACVIATSIISCSPESDPSPADEFVLENLTLLRTDDAPNNGTLRFLTIKELSVTSDGRIHTLYELTNSSGPGLLFRRTYNANGDSIGAPTIHNSVINIASKNDVTNNWRFKPYSDILTLSYHPDLSYVYRLYVVDDPAKTYQYSNASFGELPRMCWNGSYLSAGGYTQYHTNSTVLQSQHFFTWSPSLTKFYFSAELHVTTMAKEDKIRRGFAADPIDNENLGVFYMDGEYMYAESYNSVTEKSIKVDSIASAVLKPLNRISVADASMTSLPSSDEKSITLFVKSVSGAFPGDGMTHYSVFKYTKATKKLEKLVESHIVPNATNVYFASTGELYYGQGSEQSDEWTIYKVDKLSGKTKVAAFRNTIWKGLSIGIISEQFGKVFIGVDAHSAPGSERKPTNYLFQVK